MVQFSNDDAKWYHPTKICIQNCFAIEKKKTRCNDGTKTLHCIHDDDKTGDEARFYGSHFTKG